MEKNVAVPAVDAVHRDTTLIALAVSAIGIVFGDIGTSPLYTLKECFHQLSKSEGALARADVLGVLSLVFWSLMLVVTMKYLMFVMRADNRGEGGIFALLALAPDRARSSGRARVTGLALLAIVGAALLYGDGMITPAISVLSAVEGIAVTNPAVAPRLACSPVALRQLDGGGCVRRAVPLQFLPQSSTPNSCSASFSASMTPSVKRYNRSPGSILRTCSS